VTTPSLFFEGYSSCEVFGNRPRSSVPTLVFWTNPDFVCCETPPFVVELSKAPFARLGKLRLLVPLPVCQFSGAPRGPRFTDQTVSRFILGVGEDLTPSPQKAFSFLRGRRACPVFALGPRYSSFY